MTIPIACIVPDGTISRARKIRQLIADLKSAGFENRGGKGSHRNFMHRPTGARVTISGKEGDDVRPYQEKQVKSAIDESKIKK